MQRTIIIRDGTGYRDCCVEVMSNLDTWFDDTGDANCKLLCHIQATHKNEVFTEGVLSRLWVLQEIMLSDNIQFVHCQTIQKSTQHSEPEAMLTNLKLSLDRMSTG